MKLQAVQDPSLDVLVDGYLHGDVSLDDAIARLHEPRPSWGELLLKVILPGDVFRRRLEMMSRLQTHVLVSGSRDEAQR